MEEEPLVCVFSLPMRGKGFKATIISQLNYPVTVKFIAEPASDASSEPLTVAVWKDGEWNIFEGNEKSDPRYLISIAVRYGDLLQGPSCSDWPLVIEFIDYIAKAERVRHR